MKPLGRTLLYTVESRPEALKRALAAGLDRLARELHVEQERLCGVVSASGGKGEPLACGFLPDHDGPHSWASLPTFGAREAADETMDELRAKYAALLEDWERLRAREASPHAADIFGIVLDIVSGGDCEVLADRFTEVLRDHFPHLNPTVVSPADLKHLQRALAAPRDPGVPAAEGERQRAEHSEGVLQRLEGKLTGALSDGDRAQQERADKIRAAILAAPGVLDPKGIELLREVLVGERAGFLIQAELAQSIRAYLSTVDAANQQEGESK
jgi:hypothetical protein